MVETVMLGAIVGTSASVLAESRIADSPATNFASSFALASGSPSDLLRSVALGGNAEAESHLGTSGGLLFYGHMGARHLAIGASPGASISSIIDISFDTEELPERDLVIAFLDPRTFGSGFDELRLQVFEEGAPMFDQTIENLATAVAFFDDNVLNLGEWMVGADAILDLRIQLDVLVTGASDGFFFDYLVGTTNIPIPAGVWLFVSALALLGCMRRKAT
jgi:hypothetical protein